MKVGVLFGGYGSQFVGMAKELYDSSRVTQELFEEASSCLDNNFVKLCFASSDIELKKIENAYVALLVVNLSLFNALQEHGIVAEHIAGMDIGEYTAVAALKGISVPDALYMLKKYAGLYATLLTQKEVGIIKVMHATESLVTTICAEVSETVERADIAVYLSEDTFLVSGTVPALELVKKKLKNSELSVKIKKYDVGGGLHSPLMDDIVKQVKMYLEKVDFHDVTTPFISSVIAQPLSKGEAIRAALMQNIHAPVAWHKVLTTFADCDVIIEIAPVSMHAELLTALYPEKKIITVADKKEIIQIKENLLA